MRPVLRKLSTSVGKHYKPYQETNPSKGTEHPAIKRTKGQKIKSIPIKSLIYNGTDPILEPPAIKAGDIALPVHFYII